MFMYNLQAGIVTADEPMLMYEFATAAAGLFPLPDEEFAQWAGTRSNFIPALIGRAEQFAQQQGNFTMLKNLQKLLGNVKQEVPLPALEPHKMFEQL